VERFSPDDPRALDSQARAKWLALIGEHARGYQREIAALRQELSPVFNLEPLVDEAPTEITDESELSRATLRLNELASGADDAIRPAFTLSAGGSPAVMSPQFRRALSGAESLARKIENMSQRLKSAINKERR